jgi:hypothetical protein
VKAAGDALDERLAGVAGDLYDVALGLARDGDRTALKMLLDRVWPVGRARPMEFAVPQINSVHDLVPAMAGVANATFTGEARPDEVAAATRVLKAYIEAIEVTDHEERLTAWERSEGIKK